jgi:hypothetical protein
MTAITIDAAMADSALIGAALGDLSSWSTWVAVLKAAFGQTLNRHERRVFAVVAGSRKPPGRAVRELWAIAGRRSGKSRIAAAIATFIATCIDHSGKLSPGEPGYVLVLAASRSQASVVFAYIEAFLQSSPILRQQIEAVTADEIRLKGNVIISVHANNFRTVRGKTLLAVIFDEAAYWRDETTAMPDFETYRAVLPGLSTTRGMLVGISSPYRRIGLLFQKFRDCFGADDADTLVVKGASAQFNSTIDMSTIERARASDPTAAMAEWDAEFRSDLSQFLDDDSIDAAIDHGRPLELPPRPNLVYKCFVDASAGRHDAFCCGIAHREDQRVIIDIVRGRKPPFDPAAVAAEYATLAKQYRCSRVVGDAYAGEWVAAAFRDAGVEYHRSALVKSGLYLEGLPAFTRGTISIPDHQVLIRELRLLERRVARSGRDSVDHGASGSDDHANVLFGALSLCRPDFEQVAPICEGFGPVFWDLPDSTGPSSVNPATVSRTQRSGGCRWGGI